MTITPALIHPYLEMHNTSKVWKAPKEKYSTPFTTSKYLEFKAMMDTTIPEDVHSQAAFTKICRHLDLLQDYKTKVPPTLQYLIVLAKLP